MSVLGDLHLLLLLLLLLLLKVYVPFITKFIGLHIFPGSFFDVFSQLRFVAILYEIKYMDCELLDCDKVLQVIIEIVVNVM